LHPDWYWVDSSLNVNQRKIPTRKDLGMSICKHLVLTAKHTFATDFVGVALSATV
jgi:hypothetical protein